MSVGIGVAYGAWRAAETIVSVGPVARASEYGWNSVWPNLEAPLHSVIEAWVNGLLDDAAAHVTASFHGVALPERSNVLTSQIYLNHALAFRNGRAPVASDPWISYVWQTQWLPPLEMLRTMAYRGNITDAALQHYLRLHGVASNGMAEAISDQWVELPSPIQMIGLSVTGSLDPANLTASKLLDEMSAEYIAWSTAAGAGNASINVGGTGGETLKLPLAAVYWAAHWRYPSFQLALEWQKRLRPNIVDGQTPRDPSGIIIESSDLEALAKIEGVSPDWRAAYNATSYKPISIRYIRILAQYGDFSGTDLVEAFMDLGFRQSNAELLAVANLKLVHTQQIKAAHNAGHGLIVDAWETGTVTTDTMKAYWAAEGLTEEQISIAVNDVSIRYQLKRVKGIIAATRKGYLSGRLSEDQARHVLESIQVDFVRINELVDDWKFERLGSMPMNAIAKLVAYAKQGIITPAYLLARLQNLGMANDDIRIIMADVTIAIQSAAQKRLQALERQLQKQLLAAEKAAEKALKQIQMEEKAAEKAKLAAIKAAQTMLNQARASLARHSSPSMIKKWLCEGVITVNDAMERFGVLGWPQQDVVRYLGDVTGPCKPDKGAVPAGVLTDAENWTTPPM